MDGVVTGLNAQAVIEVLKLYGENNVQMFEDILMLWHIEQGDE
ncbi:hypothetical protein LCGC14_0737180 [marine sediment metagenome]|uniref:Uncharacterized protein n=1 Tax=marine sediment metagenome TaxID=412755 RepID=A0A0F9Q7S5_9ZZZZ